MFDSADQVVRCLLTYTDWWQPFTTSVLQAPSPRRPADAPDGFRAGLLESLDERNELRRRVQGLEEADRDLLFLWYVAQAPMDQIARTVGVSRRQCFRRRARAVRAIVEVGRPGDSA